MKVYLVVGTLNLLRRHGGRETLACIFDSREKAETYINKTSLLVKVFVHYRIVEWDVQ